MSKNKDIIDTNDTNNNNKKKNWTKTILILSIVLTSICIFLGSYYTSVNKVYHSYKTTLITNISSINEVNQNISQFNSNQTIDVNYARKQLPNMIKNLSTLRDTLANSKPTLKYKGDNENLTLGLDKNLLMYRQTLAILNNPSGKDVAKSTQDLKTFRNDCMNFYSLINISNTKIALPKTSLAFIDNVLNYSDSAVMVRKETDIKSQQNQEFLTNTDALSVEFLDARTNLYLDVLKVRKKEMSYDDVLSIVNDEVTKLNKTQNDFNNLSVPPSAIPTYQAFKPILDTQDSYLMDFKLALTSEKVQALSAVIDSSSLDALYTSSNALYIEVQSSYNNFTKVYTDLKSKK
ncbi:hypothetical protein LGK95_16460 [Clostridium algoriphilum]|uniref:hypothetical protein n=1 Tax=Clostridium algoriphilum TaxID=198347 RepID=UPI001CF2D12B|nr:hypothetical protein [Clostridium algoriphilum]MCB2295077.1 hypothetical protein [Clostridium algoriphilum]